jgi:hypothetical protein
MRFSSPFPLALIETGTIGMVMVTEPDQIFNLGEALLWILISFILAYNSIRHKSNRVLLCGASLSFFLFGISDFIEMHTRAWYHPWPLFALKASCVVSFILHLVCYAKQKRGKTIVAKSDY